MEIAKVNELLFELPVEKKSEEYFKVKFIGIGGCGCNITQRLHSLGMRGNVYAINTDALQLRSLSSDINRLLIGKAITKGLGAGGNSSVGAKAMEESLEAISKFMVESDLSVIAVGLGGGTGTGGVIPLAKKLKELGNDVVVIATIPFKFERAKRESAKKTLKEIAEIADAIILFDNQTLMENAGSMVMTKAFMVIDEKISDLLNSLNNSFNKTGLINIDYSDFKGLLQKAKGFATFSISTLNKSEDLLKLDEILRSELVLGDKESAKGFIFSLEAPNSIPIGDAIRIMSKASLNISKSAEVTIGVNLSDCLFYAKLFSVYMGVEIDVDSL